MKNINATILLVMVAWGISTSVTSCKKETFQEQNQQVVRNVESQTASSAPVKAGVEIIRVLIEDANGETPAGDATLLYNTRGHTPLLAPDGHHVTLGEYNMLSGWSDVKCLNGETHGVLHLKGLIPKGQYTLWIATFKSPGFDGTFVNEIGFGVVGDPGNFKNDFKASDGGTASISFKMPEGPLSIFGSVGACLGTEFETHFYLFYHIDNQTHLPGIGPPDTWILQGRTRYFGTQFH